MEQISTPCSRIRCLKYKRGGRLPQGSTCILIVFLMLCTITKGYAQKGITGTVKDANGTFLPGVNVKLKGSGTGASTDRNGRYALQISDLSGTLVFSYIGFNAYEVAINGRSTLDVVLQESDNSLEDVVVVGYGTKTRASLTGAVSSITNKELQTTTTPDILNLMTGKLPGLRVQQRSSEPGNYVASFDIRNMGSPLVIVDGVPGDNFRTLDPNEIESMTILKDASAAVYGVRAANGVLLITTKKGTAGKSVITYSATYGLTQFANNNAPLNAYENAVLNNESNYNLGYNFSQNNGDVLKAPLFTNQQLEQYKTGEIPTTDWYGLIIDNYVPQVTHNLSGRGGSDKMTYFFSLGYFNEEGVWKSGDLWAKKYNFRSNITAKITNSLEAEFLLNGVLDVKHEPGETSAGVINIVNNQDPKLGPYANNNPEYLQNVVEQRNPVAGAYDEISGYRHRLNKNFNGIFALNYTAPFLEGLKAKFMYNKGYTVQDLKSWKKKHTLYDYDIVTKNYLPSIANGPLSALTQTDAELNQSLVQGSINYDRKFLEDHTIKATLVFEENRRTITGVTGSRQFSLDAVDQLYAGDAASSVITSAGSVQFTGYPGGLPYPQQSATQSYIGRLNYDYKGKYLLEGTFNYNGSSFFGPGKQWGFFPAVSAGWRISEEGFIKNNLPFINNLKIRASLGRTGDQSAVQNYQWITGYNYPTAINIYGDGAGTAVSGLGFRALPNPDLTWYSSEVSNVGVDGNFWTGKLNFSMDVFRRNRRGLLVTPTAQLPGTVGAALAQANIGKDQVQGFELVLGHSNKIRELIMNISGNFTYSRQKVTYTDRLPNANSYFNWTSNTIDRYNAVSFGYHTIGQFSSREDLNNSPAQDGQGNRTLLPGDLKYQDWNEDGIIDGNDQHPIARLADKPEVTFAATLDFQWKGFDLNFLFQGGSSIFVRYAGLHLESPLVWGRNGYALFMDRWHREDPVDPNSNWIPGKYPSTRSFQPNAGLTTNNYLSSDYWIHNAKYLRLKSMQIGYTIPKKVFSKIGIQSIRVFANGSNLLTWSGIKIVDPELYNSQFGLEYPITRIYNFGLNASF